MEIKDDLHAKGNILHVEFESTILKLNTNRSSEGKEPHSLQPRDFFTWMQVFVGKNYPFLFMPSSIDSRSDFDQNEGFESVKSMKAASLVQDYRSVIALSHFAGANHPYSSFPEKKNKRAVRSTNEASLDVLVVADEQKILDNPFRWIQTADKFLRSILMPENELQCEGDFRFSEFKSFKSIKLACLVQNYRSINSLHHFYGAGHPFAAVDLTVDLGDVSNLEKLEDPPAFTSCCCKQRGAEVSHETLQKVESGQKLNECKSTKSEMSETNNSMVTVVQQRETSASHYDKMIEDLRDDVENIVIWSDVEVKRQWSQGDPKVQSLQSYIPHLH
jgi:hypothetical protein